MHIPRSTLVVKVDIEDVYFLDLMLKGVSQYLG